MQDSLFFEKLVIAGLPMFLFITQSWGVAAPLPQPLWLKSMNGDTLNSAAYEEKALVLVFWANWCIPCRKEVPQINALYQAAHDLDVNILGINEDEETAQGLSFIERYAPQYPSLRDQDFRYATEMNVHSLPQVLVLSARGDELYRAVEPPSLNVLQELVGRRK